jgi:hypothetical protein
MQFKKYFEDKTKTSRQKFPGRRRELRTANCKPFTTNPDVHRDKAPSYTKPDLKDMA